MTKYSFRLHVLLFAVLVCLCSCQTVSSFSPLVPDTTYSCVDGGVIAAAGGLSGSHIQLRYTLDGTVFYEGRLRSVPSDFGQRFRSDESVSFWINGGKALFSRPGGDMLLCHENTL